MPAQDLVRQEILEAFHRYVQAYFRERNLDATLACLDPGVTGFGSGFDERLLSGFGEELYRRDLEQCPTPIDIELRQVHAEALGEECGVVCAELDLATVISGQPFLMNGLRSSNVFLRRDGQWRLAHMHISMPWQPQAEGEAYPLRELEERNRQLEAMVAERTEELRQALEDVKRLARIDSVTGLANRLAFEEAIAHEIAYAQRYAAPLAMIVIDVDHFKRINDRHGHLKGDDVLRRLAQLITHQVRDADSVYRWGGEEFMILLPNTTIEHALVCAEHLRQSIENQDFGLGQATTASFGVAGRLPDEHCSGWIRRADVALYRAKAEGRNQVRLAE